MSTENLENDLPPPYKIGEDVPQEGEPDYPLDLPIEDEVDKNESPILEIEASCVTNDGVLGERDDEVVNDRDIVFDDVDNDVPVEVVIPTEGNSLDEQEDEMVEHKIKINQPQPKRAVDVINKSEEDTIREECAEVWKVVSNGEPYLEAKGLQWGLSLMGRYYSIREINGMIHEVDLDGDGNISELEFQLFCLERPKDDYQRIRGVFDTFDVDNNGVLDLKEFKELLMSSAGQNPLTDEEFQFMVKRVDRNGDGIVTIDEFLTSMEIM